MRCRLLYPRTRNALKACMGSGDGAIAGRRRAVGPSNNVSIANSEETSVWKSAKTPFGSTGASLTARTLDDRAARATARATARSTGRDRHGQTGDVPVKTAFSSPFSHTRTGKRGGARTRSSPVGRPDRPVPGPTADVCSESGHGRHRLCKVCGRLVSAD